LCGGRTRLTLFGQETLVSRWLTPSPVWVALQLDPRRKALFSPALDKTENSITVLGQIVQQNGNTGNPAGIPVPAFNGNPEQGSSEGCCSKLHGHPENV
jgi:hypothetical protein